MHDAKPSAVQLDLSRAVWQASSKKPCEHGEDSGCCDVQVAFVDEYICVRNGGNPEGAVLIFTADEWDAFVGGAKDGEFDLD